MSAGDHPRGSPTHTHVVCWHTHYVSDISREDMCVCILVCVYVCLRMLLHVHVFVCVCVKMIFKYAHKYKHSHLNKPHILCHIRGTSEKNQCLEGILELMLS